MGDGEWGVGGRWWEKEEWEVEVGRYVVRGGGGEWWGVVGEGRWWEAEVEVRGGGMNGGRWKVVVEGGRSGVDDGGRWWEVGGRRWWV